MATGDRSIDEAVVGDVVGWMPRSLHLCQQLPGATDISTRTVALHQRVVRDDIQGAVDLLHLLHEGAGALHVACGDTHVQDAIVRSHVQCHPGSLQPGQHAEGPVHVAVTASGADQRHVILDVQAGRPLGELPREVRAATLHRELHEAAVHHGVGFEAILTDLVVEAAGLVVHATIRINLHQGTVHRDSHAAAPTRELHDLLREAQELCLRAARQEAYAEALAHTHTGVLHLAEELERARVGIHGAEFQQGVVGAGEQWQSRLAAQPLYALCKLEVPTAAAILQQQGHCLRCEREVCLHVVEDLQDTAGVARDSQELRHREGRNVQAVALHLPQLPEHSVHQAVLEEALDGQ
mmetsp:Transcript_136720/g.381020  ORF Transcript_136720/g.381020 Transcript_136720/m.381020 type:complete len:352 (+) Transcript_136720:1591-2646(+)